MSEPLEPARTELSLIAIGQFLWRHMLLIGICVVIFGAAAAALAFVVTPRYRAEVAFSPTSSSGSFGEIGGEIGGLAAIAGINIGGANKKSEEALEYLRSRGFTRQFIQRHGLMPLLFAKSWDPRRAQWRAGREPPTLAEGVKRFQDKIRQIAEDRRTGVVTLSIVWSDRVVAADWANALVAEADDALRQRGIAELNRSIAYLKSETEQAAALEIQSAVYKVMESELKDAMVARTRDAYAFKILDPAVPPDPKDIDSPNKILYVALGGVFGLVVGVIFAASRQRRSIRRER